MSDCFTREFEALRRYVLEAQREMENEDYDSLKVSLSQISGRINNIQTMLTVDLPTFKDIKNTKKGGVNATN